MNALNSNTTGEYNTAIGYGAGGSAGDLTNATAIGNGAIATESNQVVIGNSDVTSIGGIVSWSILSDGRIKKNIEAKVPGLTFINKLQPVIYNLDFDAINKIQNTSNNNSATMKAANASKNRIYTGFVAQDVKEAAQSIGYDFSGVDVPENESGLLRLRYSDFVAPLVKAVQELSDQNEKKDLKISSLENRVEQLEELVSKLLK